MATPGSDLPARPADAAAITELELEPESPIAETDNGRRAKYTYRSRNRPGPKLPSKRFLELISEQKIIDDFVLPVNDSDPTGHRPVKPCCKNLCCAQLLGSPACFDSPSAELAQQRAQFVANVKSTRAVTHGTTQCQSGDRLISNLRLGYSLATTALVFAPDYSFSNASPISQEGKQNYYWRLEDGSTVQVGLPSLYLRDNSYFVSVN